MKYLRILTFSFGFFCLETADALAECSFQGAQVVTESGTVFKYATVKEALDVGYSNVTIKVGTGSENEVLKPSKGENIVLTTDCGAGIAGLDISRTKGLTVSQLSIQTSGPEAAIVVRGADRKNERVALENLKVSLKEFGSPVDGVLIQTQNSGVRLKGVEIKGFTGNAVTVGDGADAIKIEGCTLAAQGQHGIAILGNSAVEMRDNIIQGNGTIDRGEGYGIYIGPSVSAATLIATGNIVSFNLGKLATETKSDIFRADALTESSHNKSTLGKENGSFESVLPEKALLLNAEAQARVDALPDSEKALMQLIALMVDQSIQSQDISADRYAYVRQQQAEYCLLQSIGNRQFDELRKLFEGFVETDYEKLSKFIHRFDSIEKFEAFDVPSHTLCSSISTVLR